LDQPDSRSNETASRGLKSVPTGRQSVSAKTGVAKKGGSGKEQVESTRARSEECMKGGKGDPYRGGTKN